jgi:intracellular septation protein
MIKLLADILPLAAFFIAYKFAGLITATIALVVATILAVAVLYAVERKISLVPLISALVVALFGLLTIMSGNPLFIKIKPTIINCLFASILLGGAYFNKGLLKFVFAGDAFKSVFSLTDAAWVKLSIRWGIFFLCLAVLNELIWRNFPEPFWVKFKVFGMLPLTMGFALLQMPFIKRHSHDAGERS